MPTLLCFGFGYSAEHFVASFGDAFERVIGTVRSAERAAVLNAHPGGRLKALLFDGVVATPELIRKIAAANYLLVSAPPADRGDPALSVCGDALAHAPHLQSIVYLSTVGVYGDANGAWVDETTPPHPGAGRSHGRLAAEAAWQKLGARRGIPVAVFRLAGIYGPGQNALTQIVRGAARRIVKPGQIFNRIHVADIAQAIDAAFARKADGIFNIADDEPAPASDPIAFAAELLGVAPPPEIAFADAAVSMTPLALSFWQECRRVRNDKFKRALGIDLLYPTYREGLRALYEDMRNASSRGA